MENNNFNQSEDITDTDFEERADFENDDNHLQSQGMNQESKQADDYAQNQGSTIAQDSEAKAEKQSLFSKFSPFKSKKTTPETSEPEVSEADALGAEVSEVDAFGSEVSEPEVSEVDARETKLSEPEVSEADAFGPEVSEPEVSAAEKGGSVQNSEHEYDSFGEQTEVQGVIQGSIQWNEQNAARGNAYNGGQEVPHGNVQPTFLPGNYPYAPDEFDAPYESPIGIHRKPVTAKTYLLPVLVAILAGAIVAVSVFFLVYKGTFFSGSPETDSGTTPSATVTTTNTTPPTSPSTSSSPETPEPEQTPDVAAPVAVSNASGITGLASQKASSLTEAGYTDVTSGNWALDTPPAQNTVYYASDDEKVTADDVAETLGITDVVLKDYGNGAINVVIVSE
jgi:hypothetical protein